MVWAADKWLSWVPRLPAGDVSMLLPSLVSPEAWEHWRVHRGESIFQRSLAKSDLNDGADGAILGLSTAEVFCVQLWLHETDEARFSPMIALQLEARGFKFPDQTGAFQWSVITTQPTRTLVLVGVLPPRIEASLLAANCASFDLAVRFRHYRENALTIWREQDRLCLAFTRGSQLAHFQALSDASLSPSVIRDIVCIQSALKMQEVIEAVQSVVLWFEAEGETIRSLHQAMGVEVHTGVPPQPRLPEKPWSLEPGEIVEARKIGKIQATRTRYLQGAALLYALILAFLLGRLLVTSLQIGYFNWWLQDNQTKLGEIQHTLAQWDFAAPLVQKEDYPLETLLRCANSLPANAAHLTFFDQHEGHIYLRAEAGSAAQAFAFLDKLKQDPVLAKYQWVMPSPKLLPNDLAQFQMEGTPANAH